MLGADLARRYDAGPGDLFDIQGETFDVVGILEPTLMFFDNTAFIPLEAGQDALAQGGSTKALTSTVTVYPEAGADIGDLAQSMEAALPQTRAMSGEDFEERFGSTVAIFNAIILSVALISIVVGSLTVINTMTMSIAERTRKIGIKRAIGATGASSCGSWSGRQDSWALQVGWSA